MSTMLMRASEDVSLCLYVRLSCVLSFTKICCNLRQSKSSLEAPASETIFGFLETVYGSKVLPWNTDTKYSRCFAAHSNPRARLRNVVTVSSNEWFKGCRRDQRTAPPQHGGNKLLVVLGVLEQTRTYKESFQTLLKSLLDRSFFLTLNNEEKLGPVYR